jgi:S-DNA-T family DNA segregation ATPase FtsK/SpoIIIE
MAPPRSRSRSRARSRTNQPSPRAEQAAPLLAIPVGFLMGFVMLWYGLPGTIPVWIALVLAAWATPMPELSGTDAARNPVPAGPREESALRRFNFARSAKWGLVFPVNAFWPGWPIRAAWLGGWLAAAVAMFLPHRALPYVPLGITNLIDGCLAFVIVTALAAARRDSVVIGDRSPGVRIDALKNLWAAPEGPPVPGVIESKVPRWAWFAGIPATAIVGAALGWFYLGPTFGVSSTVWSVLGGILAASAYVGPEWVKASLAHWRMVVAARKEWAPSWDMLKQANAPVLTDRQKIGPAVVDTFTAHGSVGSAFYLPMTDKITATRGGQVRLAIAPVAARDSQGQEMPGTIDPLGFQVISWPNDFTVNVADPATDPDIARLFVQSAIIWAAAAWAAQPIIDEMTPLAVAPEAPAPPLQPEAPEYDEDGEPIEPEPVAAPEAPTGPTSQTWQITLHMPNGPGWKAIRDNVAPALGGTLGVEVSSDHRPASPKKPQPSAIYVGNLSADPTLDPNQPVTAQYLKDLTVEDQWNSRWKDVLKTDNLPTINSPSYTEARLEGGAVVCQQAFITRMAQPPETFFGKEKELRATLSGAPFVHIGGWQLASRAGDRHGQAVAVWWSNHPVPQAPDFIAPARVRPGTPASRVAEANLAQKWVLSGQVAVAFKAARLAMPETHRVECLTDPRGRTHIWKMHVRLYGGVTIADVRAQANRLRGELGTEWLRVGTAKDGIVIVAGANPKRARFASREFKEYAVALDWEQAYMDAKVVGVGGLTPTLTAADRLPNNEQVEVLDFTLPTGLAFVDVKAGAKHLETASRNAFVEVRRHPSGKADEFRILASEVNPMPERAAFDFAAADTGDHKIPFATNLFGEPTCYDNKLDPHLLISGTSGGGKSVALQAFVYGAVARGWDLWVADPSKGGVDFQFAEPWARAFARTVWEARGMVEAIYADVLRRKAINAQYNCGNYRDLPEEVRYPHVLIVLDEFTSMMMPEPVPKAMDDSEETLRGVESVKAINAARAYIGTYVGKIVREARSTGFTMVLATQALKAETLSKIPGANDLKDNMSRMIVGRASSGQLAAALKMPYDVPEQPDVLPPGRGLYEGGGFTAQTIQTWFEGDQNVFAQHLHQKIKPLPQEMKLDMSGFVEPELEVDGEILGGSPDFVPEPGVTTLPTLDLAADEIVELPEFTFTLDGLDLDDADDGQVDETLPEQSPASDETTVFAAPEPVDIPNHLAPQSVPAQPEPDLVFGFETPAAPSAPAEDIVPVFEFDAPAAPPVVDNPFETPSPAPAPLTVVPDPEPALVAAPAAVAEPALLDDAEAVAVDDDIVWDEIDPEPWEPSVSEYGWTEIDALNRFLTEFPQVRTVTWTDPHLHDEDEMGLTFAEVAVEVAQMHGVTLQVGEPPSDEDRQALAAAADIPVFDIPVTPAPALAPVPATAPASTPDPVQQPVTVPAATIDDDPFAEPPPVVFDLGPDPFA